MRLNLFDKICAILAILLGGVFLVLGGFGIFTGCKAHFTLPPLLGVIPALVGWGMVKAVIVAWKHSSPDESSVNIHSEITTPSEINT